jgi:2-oxoglutarate ferredoxin oxidoreductase subunit delta
MEQEKNDPKAGSEPRKKRRYKIDIFQAWCKACGICVAFCPQKCLDRDEEGNPVIAAQEKCTGCGWCEIHCPDFAIGVREEKDDDRPRKEDDGNA